MWGANKAMTQANLPWGMPGSTAVPSGGMPGKMGGGQTFMPFLPQMPGGVMPSMPQMPGGVMPPPSGPGLFGYNPLQAPLFSPSGAGLGGQGGPYVPQPATPLGASGGPGLFGSLGPISPQNWRYMTSRFGSDMPALLRFLLGVKGGFRPGAGGGPSGSFGGGFAGGPGGGPGRGPGGGSRNFGGPR